ncbi:MAG: DNA polymerase III subunit alpha, partial [Casimicrobiaceae bacterium]
LDDALTYGIRFEPPDVNAGEYQFVPIDRATIRYGLGGVKGTGESAINEILRARASGPFASLYDFCRRVNLQIVNRRSIEALVKAGAFDRLHENRASVLASVAQALMAAERALANAGQNSLFDDEAAVDPPLIQAQPWPLLEALAQEKSALGLYLSGHPFEAWRDHLAPMATLTLARAEPSETRHRVAGIVNAVRVMNARTGRMCFVTLDDRTDVREIMLPANLFEAHRHWLREDIPVVMEVRINTNRDGEPRLIAEQIHDIEQARALFGRRVVIHLNGSSAAEDARRTLATLRTFAGDGPAGTLPVTIQLERTSNASSPGLPGYGGRISLGESLRVVPRTELFSQLNATLEF